jgi:hypothetical protein
MTVHALGAQASGRPAALIMRHPPNPIRSEADAFGFLVWFVAAVAVIVVVVLIIEALA